MTVHGVIDMHFGPANNVKQYSEFFVSINRFLTSSFGQKLGAKRIAYSTGTAFPTAGTDYWDEGSPWQTNGWATYQFLSATNPYYMLIQFGDTNSITSVPGAPVAFDGTTAAVSGVAFAFAMRTDGNSPWNGTTKNDGTDTKGTPVWTAGTSSLYVWPRSNNTSGSSATNREGMMSVPQAKSNSPGPTNFSRAHMVCDPDNIFITFDEGGTGAYWSLYFGRYTPRAGEVPVMPYVCLRSAVASDDPTLKFTTYGNITDTTALPNGGIAHPTEPVSGTKIVEIHTVANFLVAKHSPNQVYFNTWDEWPIYLAINESPLYGFCGAIDFIRYIYGVWSQETNSDKTRAFFGNASYNSMKISVPWDGATVPGLGQSRSGTLF